jgi:putative peptidoglycan lipid II flippase
MIKNSIFITSLFIINTAIQLVSQIVVTRLFGASVDLEVFLAAVTIPTILVTILYGSINEAFLPFYSKRRHQNEEEAQEYFLSHVIQLSFLSFIITLLLGFVTYPISELLYASRGEEFVQQVALQMQYLLYGIPVSVIATLFGTHYYAHKKFIRFPLAQAVGSIANLLLIIALHQGLGIWALVTAFVLNIVLQILLVIPPSLVARSFKMVNMLPFLMAWIPLFLGAFASRSDALLLRSFSANLPEGFIVYLNLGSKIFSLATGVMTVGIQIILLPHLVEYFHNKEHDKAFTTVARAKIAAVFISIVVTFVLLMFAPFIINLLFIGGKFTAADAKNTITLLPLFVLPAIGWGISSIFTQPLLALHKHMHVGIIHIISLVLGWAVATGLNIYVGPLPAISGGLITLIFTGIIGMEALWQFYKKKLIVSHQTPKTLSEEEIETVINENLEET